MSPALQRFFKYTSVGVSTFLLDLALLFVLTDACNINYVLSAGISFLLAVSINYFLSRRFVFQGSVRDVQSGYFFFIGIALVGLLFVTVGMYLLVSVVGMYYLLARVLVAVFTGFWNYLMNLFFNFKVAGKH